MAEFSSEQLTSEDKLWAGLAYTGLALLMIPTVVIFLLKREESDYIKFHGLQAMGIWLLIFVAQVVLIMAGMIPVLGIVAGLISFLLGLVTIGLWVYLMIMAFTGKHFEVPILAAFIQSNLMG